ncbi:HNH/ENDO VII family nuclease [Paenibacillus sp. MMS20-IR301]|uniref:HNH/ENDO VII family nuclease n=1 Tax=Paenibacillus sp. MMS20-IR301 TaxID=2895946 RepID=UPI0028EB2EB5|nr:HNH/ENDO VII family nuclease [Paenibacillus sp. MMS20-IR301]WNS43284.1 HNH/ENDO VII family nuclease [Paenibacillus sp. MMS20-IR301]
MDRQEHLYLAQKKASTPAPAKPASPAPAKPAQTTKPAATVSAKQAPAKAVTAAPVTPKPAAKTSAPATSVAQSKTAATMANLTKQNQLLAAELKIAKKNEQAAQATKAAAKKDPVPVKPAASGKGSTSVINKVATGAKNLVVDTFNLAIGDDVKLAFGKKSTFLEQSIGSASLLLNVVTLGEAGAIKSAIKGAIQTTEKAITKNLVVKATVKDAVEVGNKVTQQGLKETGQVLKKETLSGSSGGVGNGKLKPTKLTSDKIQLDSLPDKYTAVEVTGSVKVAGQDVDVSRRVYQIEIDKNYVPKDPAAIVQSNKELMSKGKSPYVVKDGVESKVELHHLIQKEPGNMVEIAESTHDKFSSQLHGLIEDGNSFRNNPSLEKQYNNFRNNYWKMRSNED